MALQRASSDNQDRKSKNIPIQNQLPTRWIIDGWELPSGAILAPMAGVTDSPTRRIARRFGAGLLYSECISAEGLRRLGKASLDYCRFHPEERPIALQLFGSRAEQIGEAARVVADRFHPDLIDINCGCPVKKFVTKGCGGALMQSPNLIGEMVAAASKSGLPISVKLRTGYWPGIETAVDAAKAAADAGAALIAVHGRYVRKAKGTQADWNPIHRVREAVPHLPVIGNGDVFSPADAKRMIDETGCDRVMIARWAQGRPWIFRSLQNRDYPDCAPTTPAVVEVVELIGDHYRMMIDLFGEKTAVFRMRKQVGWITSGWPGGAKLRSEIMLIPSAGGVIRRLNDYLDIMGRDWIIADSPTAQELEDYEPAGE